MNKDSFLLHVEKTRDCGQSRLDSAVMKGINRAKSDRIDPQKILGLAAACVITFTMCLTLNTKPFKTAVDEYYKYMNESMQESSQVLAGYIDDITETIIKYLGGE